MPNYRLEALLFILQQAAVSANHLTLQEFQSVWHSDLDHHSYEDALESFDTETAFVTQTIVSMAGFEEDAMAGVGTLVCSSEMNASGYERIQQMVEQLNISIDTNTSVLHNTDEMTCVLSSLSPRTIASKADAGKSATAIKLTPLTSYMKIRSGALNSFESLDSDEETLKGLDVQLCGESEDIYSLAEGILKRIHSERDEMGRSLSLSKSFHWTLEDLDHEAILRANGRRLSDSHRTRVNRWREVAANGINAEHQCQSMFDSIDILPMTSGSFGITLGHGVASDLSSSASSSCTLSLLAALTSNEEVCSVGHFIQPRLVNDNAQWITQSGVQDERPFWDAGLAGNGQVVAVSDSGLDTDNCYFWDSSPGELKDGTLQSSRRKVIQYVSFADAVSADYDHGTHVTGSVAGHKSIDGVSESTGFADGSGRDAKISFFDIGFGTGCCNVPGTSTLFGPGYDASARIHSGSWGAFYNGAPYSSFSQSFDEYASAFDDMLIVMAAGNDGSNDAMSTIGSPATAKNVISVGAGMNENQFSGASKYLAYFSSRGPTQDNRIKPDIVAPGFSILSAGAVSSVSGECDPATHPDATSGSYNGLTYMSGTSMATPITSGNLAIIRQYLAEGWYANGAKGSGSAITSPSSALMKAILLNGGQQIESVYQTNGSQTPSAMYDNHQGFGLMNLSTTLPLSGTNSFFIDLQDRMEMTPNGQHVNGYAIQNTCGTDDFSATLVWTDPAAASSGCTSCLVNDLDLTVIVDGATKRPNGITDTSLRDSSNNVERVSLTGLVGSESISVVVSGTNLSSATQNYALVVTGCINSAPVAPVTPPPTRSPTKAPSSQPTTSSAPTIDLTNSKTLVTTLEGGSGQSGNMFDLVAINDVTITSFDVVSQATSTTLFEVYTKVDSYTGFATSATAWTLLGSESVAGLGVGNRVALSPNQFNFVKVSKEDTQGFYVTMTSTTVGVSYTVGNNIGAIYVADDNLQFLQGSGIAYPFVVEFKPRIFNGAINYLVDAVETNEPTTSPSIKPSAVVTGEPTASPSIKPSAVVTGEPTASPSIKPTATVTGEPSATPSIEATAEITGEPTASPSIKPTAEITGEPTASPSITPTAAEEEGSASPTLTLNVYARALQLLQSYEVSMTDDEKNALIADVRNLLQDYIASLSQLDITFEDENIYRLLQVLL